MGMEKFSKPGLGKWRVVQKAEEVFEVRTPDNAVYGRYSSLSQAAATASTRQKETDLAARRKTRACMCCTEPFQSEGIHNRLCSRCRSKEADNWNPYGLAPRSGRAK
ncbi:MAG: hypothetical protein MUE52_04235 [Tabrizicola sp.]|jgi:hypothetical protein|nr:hypothetical protein [Tabrizicola sp.]